MDSPYKAIVSVLMLKEGWDVRNVTTIVGLRAYSAKSNILPEQTLGRGLRKMYPGNTEEYVSVVGTDAFMDFVESIQAEGVELERKAMGEGTKPKTPLIVEVDNENDKKDIDALDIEIPVLTPRVYREYKNLADLDGGVPFQTVAPGVQRGRTARDRLQGHHHRRGHPYHGARQRRDRGLPQRDRLLRPDHHEGTATGQRLRCAVWQGERRLSQDALFGKAVDLESPNTLRNLSELAATKTVIETFKKAINDLTVQDKGDAEIRDTIKLRKTRPFVVKEQGYMIPKKSVFNRVIGDSHFELEFANFLEACPDVVSYAKNYLAVHFKLDYVNADGDISNYYPDFIARVSDGRVVIVETKGQEDLDVPSKMERLKQWCEDVNRAQRNVVYDFAFVDDEGFKKYAPKSFTDVLSGFTKYKAT